MSIPTDGPLLSKLKETHETLKKGTLPSFSKSPLAYLQAKSEVLKSQLESVPSVLCCGLADLPKIRDQQLAVMAEQHLLAVRSRGGLALLQVEQKERGSTDFGLKESFAWARVAHGHSVWEWANVALVGRRPWEGVLLPGATVSRAEVARLVLPRDSD